MKRILSITIKRITDDSPDTSWLGEYSNQRTSDFSIDRKHTLECSSVNPANIEIVDKLERVVSYLDEQRRLAAFNDSAYYLPLDSAQDVLIEAQESLTECDCDESGDMQRGEYRYFNPSFNYVDANGNLLPENTANEVRGYVAQDYARMERINSGDIGFVCIAAVAEIQLTVDGLTATKEISSGYICGIESDSDESDFKETEAEQLSELRSQLSAIGFSKRAIATAVKNLVESE